MPISQNTALFSLLGTSYGGDGRSTFALPDLQGRAAMHPGNGPGLTDRQLGERGGSPVVTLLESEMPAHNHGLKADKGVASVAAPSDKYIAGGNLAFSTSAPNTALAPASLPPAGASAPHNNMQPYLTLNYIIALQGIYPSRQ